MSSPPAIVRGVTCTGSPAASAGRSAADPSGSTADDPDAARGDRRRDPGHEPASADGDDDDVRVRGVLEDLEPDGPLPGHHERIVEGMDERRARRRDVLLEARERSRRVGRLGVDPRSERPGAVELERARRRPGEDDALDALARSAPREGDRMVPRGRAGDAVRALLDTHRRQPVRDAARLERARVLEELRLEPEAGGDVRAVQQRCAADATADRLRGAHDVVAREGVAAHAPIVDTSRTQNARVDMPADHDRPGGRPDAMSPDAVGRRPHPIALHVGDDLRRPRLIVAFRPLLVVPHLCWLGLWAVPAALAALAAWAVALVTGRVPAPLHRFLAAFVRATAHVSAFLHVVGRPYPGFLGREGSYPVDLTVSPPARQRRLGVLVRLVLALPALLLAVAYALLVTVVGVLAWFAALATGRMPAGLRDLGAAGLRYEAQTAGYVLLLTARYPDASPRLDPPAGEDAA